MADDSDFYTPYKSLATTIRAWFVYYGIGAIAFTAANKHIFSSVKGSGRLGEITIVFSTAILLQILFALIYKGSMSYEYMKEVDDKFESKIGEFLSCIKDSWHAEFWADVISFLLLAYGTYTLVGIVSS